MPYQQYQTYGADPLTAPGPTPEQVALQRRIAEQLLNPAGGFQPIHAAGTAYFSPWQGAANIANQLMGNIRSGYANRLEQQGRGQYGQQYGNFVAGANQQPFNQAPPQTGSGGALPFAGQPSPSDLKAAILMQESGNNPNIRNSIAGAVGPGQIMPGTFAQFAKPGENIGNPAGNRNVSGRILDTYMAQYGDPARAAVAYFSGPGNVAPPGNPTPWISDRKDANGKSVSSYVSDVVGRMGGGQQTAQAGAVDPRLLGAIEANPWASEATKGALRGYAVPQPVQDVYGQPGAQSLQGGVRPMPVQPGFQPGFRAPVTVGPDGGISSTVVTPAPGQGVQAPSVRNQVQGLYETGQDLARQSAANKATREQIVTDVNTAYNSIPVVQTLNQMRDTIAAHGDKMVWGNTSDWMTNVKRGIAQYAPGFFNEKELAGIAAADDFEKLSAQLQTAVGRQVGPTDASLLQGIKSVPGSHNSREGALALIDMLAQVAKLNTQFMVQNQANLGQPGFDYLKSKTDFFEKNPIVNPITGNPIRVDLQKRGVSQGATETRVIGGKTYYKINGEWHSGM